MKWKRTPPSLVVPDFTLLRLFAIRQQALLVRFQRAILRPDPEEQSGRGGSHGKEILGV
jgi:hypothetical protein